jgi:RHS repeat-associated protein
VTQWHYDAADRLSRRTVDGEPAEQWQYDEHGWLTEISHLSEGHRVAVQYEYDKQGRMSTERQTVQYPDTDALLWRHVTKHDDHHGLAHRTTPDRLPAVEWLTYGSGHLAGLKLGDTPLISFARDRLHRETQREAGTYEQSTRYSASGQLLSHTLSDPMLNREYGYNDNGQLVRIRGARQEDYHYDGTGRLISAQHNDLLRRYATDPAGNRLADRNTHAALPAVWRNNRIREDAEYFYHHDIHGRLTGRDERLIRDGGSHCHRYHYDHQHRLVQYECSQQDSTLTTARYLYDPLGRRTGRVVQELSRDGSPERVSRIWYGWDGDRLTTTQTDTTRIQTVYLPGSFTPLLHIETATDELEKATRRSLAEKLQQDGGVIFPAELVALLDRLEGELLNSNLSEQSQQWLAQCGLTAERIQNQLEPVHIPQRSVHLYHCDHRGLPLALISADGKTDWSAEYDVWGNVLSENNPHHLQQYLRLPGQQYDEETGLHYNRHRYYDPHQGRYITQDPIGLRGGWNVYLYPLNPVLDIDPAGLAPLVSRNTPSPGGMVFDETFWNKPENVGTNNCYTYAIDRPFIKDGHPLKFETPPVLTCKSMGVYMEQDGVISPGTDGNCPDGYHKIFLTIDPNSDFHFYRQDNNGAWSHKRGIDPVSNVDSKGIVITDPDKANRNYSRLWGLSGNNYSESCGLYCAKN